MNLLYILFTILILLVILLFNCHRSSRQKCQVCEPMNANTNNSSNKQKIKKIACFYTSWCGHSRAFLPEWDKFEAYSKNSLKNIVVKKVKCDSAEDATECS